jgi:hypothetical protein
MCSKNIRFPSSLVTSLKDEFSLKYFIETGTFLGDTAYWASQHFEKVYTIENSEKLLQQASSRYSGLNNVQFVMGDSRDKLQEIVEKVKSPAIFWLDAHWSGGITLGEGYECPLLEEIKVIVHDAYDHFILVDDARLFLAPPPKPHVPDQWPDIVSVINVLNSNQPRFIVILNDVIVAVPSFARPYLTNYCQDVNKDITLKDRGKIFSIGKKVFSLYRSLRVRLH